MIKPRDYVLQMYKLLFATFKNIRDFYLECPYIFKCAKKIKKNKKSPER